MEPLDGFGRVVVGFGELRGEEESAAVPGFGSEKRLQGGEG